MSETDDSGAGDELKLALFAPGNPIAHGVEGVEPVLEALDAHAGALAPDTVYGPSPIPYTHAAVKSALAVRSRGGATVLDLGREADPEVSYEMNFMDAQFTLGFKMSMDAPFSYFAERGHEEERARHLVSLVRALASAAPPAYAYCHSGLDLELGSDPHRKDPFAPKEVYEAYWLNLYGAEMVGRLGRERVLSTPAAHVEELPGGGVLLLTRPTPADYASEEARAAQARALAHLRPDVTFEDALARLRQRSAMLAPVAREWDADIADLLELTLEHVPLSERQQEVARLNQYRPPEVEEWRPLAQLLPADVADPAAAVERYAGLYAEQLAALLHEEVPEVMKATPQSLTHIDYHLWRYDYAGSFPREDIEGQLVPALGGYLGDVLVRNLGGRWVPRRELDEAQVVVGDRAWLPFLRARRHLRTKASALDYSLTKFYRAAARAVS